MGIHAAHRPPRAHWLLLLLGSITVLAALCVHGWVINAGGEGGPAGGRSASGGAAIAGAGPVLRIDAAGRVDSVRMPSGTVALTFDDGPDPRWTPQILDVLHAHGARATFFVVGAKVNRYPGLARRIVAEGHELGVHTFTHADLATVPAWRRDLELGLTRNAIAAATGRTARLMRPPYSSTPDSVTPAQFAAMRSAAAAGYLVVLADRDTEDWRRPGADAIVAAATPGAGTAATPGAGSGATPGAGTAATPDAAGSGAIVMLHDSGGDRSATVAATRRLLAASPGTRFSTVSEGIGLAPPPAAPVWTIGRGYAMRATQTGSRWLAVTIGWLAATAVGLALLRIALQTALAGWHVRRGRRRARVPLRFLGRVSVVVPAHNEAANIASTVRSLLANDYPWIEVVVVDDGSTDRTAEVVAGLCQPGVRLIRQANAGKPAALNTGIRAARGELLILVDGDTVFDADAVGRLVQAFADERVGAVSGNTKVANRRGLLGRWQHLEYVVGFNLDRRMFDLARCMPTIPGAIGAFRRNVLAEIGGVPDDTLAEDTDLTMAVLRAGWRVVYRDDAIAWTEVPVTLRQFWRQRYRWCYGTMQAMWKHRRAVVQRGAAGRLGRRGLAYVALFQVLLPLAAPAVDAFAIYGLIFLSWWQVLGVWCGFLAIQALAAAVALRMDRESLSPLWTLPVQLVVYRQLMCLVVVQATVAALLGGRQRWRAMARTGIGPVPGVRLAGR
jgi:cellulose synthase/poly-beta-1,6-N-acetylglucosamine synthase-like glycosyltransferase/peptidoglycan/xylan/chitin deacetylase (PgdA/CDA1 family)